MLSVSRPVKTGRLVDLERTVNTLNRRLRKMQSESYRAQAEPLAVWLWRNLMSFRGGQEYMSAVCNRRARPNTRMLFHADPRT
jgi:hypothetical protein